jgi:hypothetical protein
MTINTLIFYERRSRRNAGDMSKEINDIEVSWKLYKGLSVIAGKIKKS